MQKPRATAHPVELDRVETGAHLEILWSNGRRIRLNTFRNLTTAPPEPAERAARRRRKRARKIARRAKGHRVKALLAQHGLTPETVRFSW
jgi:hypothetical protein